MHIAGIDLGTNYARIAGFDGTDPFLYPDQRDGQALATPSLVHIDSQQAAVGADVVGLLEENPDLNHAQLAMLKLGADRTVYADQVRRSWSAHGICSLILSKLKSDVEAYDGCALTHAVIAVPMHFDERRKRALQLAAEFAGLQIAQIVPVPVAAATYATANENRNQTILVYDLGSRNFDATLLRSNHGKVEILATEGSESLGAEYVDAPIERYAEREFQRVHRTHPAEIPRAQKEIARLCEAMKVELGASRDRLVQRWTYILDYPLELVLTRRHLDSLMLPIVKSSLEVCDSCLRKAKKTWRAVDRIVLVGGATQYHELQREIIRHAKLPSVAIVGHQPQKAVAYGAGMLASEWKKRLPLADESRTTFDLALRVRSPDAGSSEVITLIPKNSPTPARQSVQLLTTRDDQNRMTIQLIRRSRKQERSLGYFDLGPFHNPHEGYPVTLDVQIVENDAVRAACVDHFAGHTTEMFVNASMQWNPDVTAPERALVSQLIATNKSLRP